MKQAAALSDRCSRKGALHRIAGGKVIVIEGKLEKGF